MATKKKAKAATKKPKAKKASTKSKKKSVKDRCWPGYEPVPGKKPFSKGSCRKIK